MTSDAPAATDRHQLDELVAGLVDHAAAWRNTGMAERAGLLRACIERLLAVAPEWVDAACRAKGVSPSSPLAGEEWISGPMVTIRLMRLLAEALDRDARPAVPSMTQRGGQQIATVVPDSLYDRMFYPGVSAEVWLEPDKPATQGRIYREADPDPAAVGLVLGAGNIASIAPTDAIHKLFVENQAVVVKMNPVNEYLTPFFERGLAPLIERGVLRFVCGGIETGHHLCHHPAVDTIHLTGSDRTFDAIVWGPERNEHAQRKAADEPVLNKPFTAELGCVTPVLVVPGPWSDGDLDFQARNVASMVTHNVSFNCTAAKVLVTAGGWNRHGAFRERLATRLGQIPTRRAYYPGAADRYARFLEHYPQAQALGGASPEGALPWTLIPEVPARRGEYALTQEAFCGVLAEVALPVDDPGAFLEQAVALANEDIWGTLSCVLLIHPATRRRYDKEFRQAVAALRYGGLGINVWTGVNFGIGATSWGAFPGHTRQEIVSGVGTVHNTYLFDHPQKSVVYGPFRPFPKPVWMADHRTLLSVGRQVTGFEAAPSLLKVPGVGLAAARG